MAFAIATPSIIINNTVAPVVPNSVTYTEGLGEQNVRSQSAGGGSVQMVYSDNAESKFSTVKFQMFPTPENINLIRTWKTNGNANAITITAPGFSRSISEAALINNYEVNLGADTQIDLEFAGRGAS